MDQFPDLFTPNYSDRDLEMPRTPGSRSPGSESLVIDAAATKRTAPDDLLSEFIDLNRKRVASEVQTTGSKRSRSRTTSAVVASTKPSIYATTHSTTGYVTTAPTSTTAYVTTQATRGYGTTQATRGYATTPPASKGYATTQSDASGANSTQSAAPLLSTKTAPLPSTKTAPPTSTKGATTPSTSLAPIEIDDDDDDGYYNEEVFQTSTGIRPKCIETMTPQDDAEPWYHYSTNAGLDRGKEYLKFKARTKKNLFKLQPRDSENPDQPIINDLFTICYSFKIEVKCRGFNKLLSTINHRPISDVELKNKSLLGQILVKYANFQETGTVSSDLLLPTVASYLFSSEEALQCGAVCLTYLLLNESLPVENTLAFLRLLGTVAGWGSKKMDIISNGFRFNAAAIDRIKITF